jgi:hypothetical protein
MGQNGSADDRAVVSWDDPAWRSAVAPLLDEIQRELNGTLRGGRVFALTVACWKENRKVGSNTEIAEQLVWSREAVAEGYRVVREHLRHRDHPQLKVEVREYSRELVVYRRSQVNESESILLSVPRSRGAILGDLLAGLGQGRRVIPMQPRTAEEEAQDLIAPGFGGRLVVPLSEADDYGAFERLEDTGRTVLLDVAVRGSDLPCVTFDYREAARQCTSELIQLGCANVVMLTAEHDSRVHDMKTGYRAALRDHGKKVHAPVTIGAPGRIPLSRHVVDRLCWLQEEELWPASGSSDKMGIFCTDETIGETLLGYFDGIEARCWPIAVAVVGGRPWPGRHWVDLVWAKLDWELLAIEGRRVLFQGSIPEAVPVACQTIPGRKPVASASAMDIRSVKAS